MQQQQAGQSGTPYGASQQRNVGAPAKPSHTSEGAPLADRVGAVPPNRLRDDSDFDSQAPAAAAVCGVSSGKKAGKRLGKKERAKKALREGRFTTAKVDTGKK